MCAVLRGDVRVGRPHDQRAARPLWLAAGAPAVWGGSLRAGRRTRPRDDAHEPLSQAAFCAQTVALPELGTSVKFEVWDTAGQERYASLAPLYYRGAAAAAVVYDVTSGESFAKAHAWVKELKKHAAPGCVIALVGNKTDLDGREVSLEAGAAYAAEQALAFIETSAKSSAGVDALFTLIAQTCTQGGGGGGTAIGAEATAPPGAA